MAERTNIPNDGMKAAARRALEWRKEGKRGGTGVGLARANQIVNGTNLSDSTVKRMYSFFSRHEVDKKATGFSSGEEGFPSPGRVAWDLWGGDSGFSWSRSKVASMKSKMEKASKGFSVGDMVSWNSSGGKAQGKIEHVMRDGVLGIPNSKFSIKATKEDPAVLIRIYKDGKPTETLVGHKMSTLSRAEVSKSMHELMDAPDDMEEPEDEWSGLNERQSDQAESLCMIVEEYGQFDQSSKSDGSHYADGNNNPFKSDGLVCSNCIFYEQNACHIVSGMIDPEGICKLWIIPEEKIMEKNMDPFELEKKEFNTRQRRQMASRGTAMPDGSYPIGNEQDLRNAIQSFGRASNPAAVKQHIVRRARALGLVRLLPEEWNITKGAESIWYGSLLPLEDN
jgi:hypothetical protein